jgi:ammonia channel protein AmtB
MDPNVALMQAMVFALAGWLACCYRIVHSQLKPRTRKLLVIPLWFGWMAFALGGPVFQGTVTVSNALSAGVAFSLGMGMALIMRRRSSRTSR